MPFFNEILFHFITLVKNKIVGCLPQTALRPIGLVEGDHEAIIPKDLFMQVQAELVRRRVVKSGITINIEA